MRFRPLAAPALALFAFAGCRDRTADPAAADTSHMSALAHEHAGDTTTPSGAVQAPRVPVRGRAFVYGNTTGYMATPADSGATPLPGLLIVHEWWGLNDNVRRMADRYAGEGYRVLAVDLYGGKVGATPDSAMALMQASMANPAAVAGNVRAAYTALAQAGAAKIGILGWCMGGGVSAHMTVAMPLQLAAAVVYYGDVSGITAAQMRPIGMPVLAFFGGKDTSIPVDTVRAFERRLKAAGKRIDLTVYPDAGHAFANPTGQNYQAGPAEQSYAKTVAFLARTLKS